MFDDLKDSGELAAKGVPGLTRLAFTLPVTPAADRVAGSREPNARVS